MNTVYTKLVENKKQSEAIKCRICNGTNKVKPHCFNLMTDQYENYLCIDCSDEYEVGE